MEFTTHFYLFNFSSKVAWSHVFTSFILTVNYNATLWPLLSRAVLLGFVRKGSLKECSFLCMHQPPQASSKSHITYLLHAVYARGAAHQTVNQQLSFTQPATIKESPLLDVRKDEFLLYPPAFTLTF